MPIAHHSLELKVPPLALAGLAALMMWVAHVAWPSSVAISSSLRLVAVLLALCGLAVAATGLIGFRKERTTVDPRSPEATRFIVTTGIYGHTRNPMYLGFALLLAAWALFLANPVAALLVPAFVAYLNRFQIGPEERALLEKFGTPYREYMARVRRWL
jgi:protein-S-isoprenylcysteine O-methyltransferase Ste14